MISMFGALFPNVEARIRVFCLDQSTRNQCFYDAAWSVQHPGYLHQ